MVSQDNYPSHIIWDKTHPGSFYVSNEHENFTAILQDGQILMTSISYVVLYRTIEHDRSKIKMTTVRKLGQYGHPYVF